jgi:hypothetical protein
LVSADTTSEFRVEIATLQSYEFDAQFAQHADCRSPCIGVMARHNGAVKLRLAIVSSWFVIGTAGMLSCGSGDSPSSSGGVDAGVDTGAVDTSGSVDSGTPISDASTLDLPAVEAVGPEADLPVDVTVDRSGDSVAAALDSAADAATVAADARSADSVPVTPARDAAVNLRLDAGVDSQAKDASLPEAARLPDAPLLDTSAPEAYADAPTADAMVMDSTHDVSTADAVEMCGRINCDCTFKGKNLWGDVEIVTAFPDFKIKVSNFPDLNVKETTFPQSCGEWHTVTAFGDFKVQIVDIFEDFDIAYSPFPGMP